MKKAIAIVLLAVMILGLLSACGGGDGKYIGVYKFSKMVSSEITMTVQEYADLFEIDVKEAEKFMILELKSGGKGTITSEDETEDITWKADGEKITLTAKNEDGADESYDATIKDGVITLALGDEDYIELTKAK